MYGPGMAPLQGAHEGQTSAAAGGLLARGGGGDGRQREEGEGECQEEEEDSGEEFGGNLPPRVTRQVVVVTIKKHGRGEGTEEPVPFQHNVVSSQLTHAELEAIRNDRNVHLITKPLPTVSGVCKMCKNRSRYHCVRCKVCLHPECFISFHVREEVRMLLQ
jgi:hypothetical protein